MKRLVRLTEGDLHRIVKESVKRILKETKDTPDDVYDEDEYSDDDNDFGDGYREEFWNRFERQHGY